MESGIRMNRFFSKNVAPTCCGDRAFTLVEVLIVVIILGILAAIVVPQFTSAAEQSRENSLAMNLFRVREQLEIYKQQHNGLYPRFADFEAQMTTASDADGNTAAAGTAGYIYGPYLRNVPINPMTNRAVVSDNPATGNGDWYYNEDTGEFRANDSDASAAF